VSQEVIVTGWRRWTESLALGVVVVLWLGGSIAALAVEWPIGVVWFCVGALYVGGEIWIGRRGDERPRFRVMWVAAWRAILGVVTIALGIVHLRWDSVVLFVIGIWFLVLAAVFARASRRERS
jgi:uncharacterized membrane protein HdeD (DUF308 family)